MSRLRHAPRWLVVLSALEAVTLGAAAATFVGSVLFPSPETLRLAYLAILACLVLSALNITLSANLVCWRRNLDRATVARRAIEERERRRG